MASHLTGRIPRMLQKLTENAGGSASCSPGPAASETPYSLVVKSLTVLLPQSFGCGGTARESLGLLA